MIDEEKPLCSVEGCEKRAHCRGWCKKHYSRVKRHGDPLVAKTKRYVDKNCSVEGCSGQIRGNGLCNAHLRRLQKYGTPEGNGKPLRSDAGKCSPCKVKGCTENSRAKSLCIKHYSNFRKHETYEAPERIYTTKEYVGRPKNAPICEINGCTNKVCRFPKSMPVEESKSLLTKVCSTHYQRWKKLGTFNEDEPVSQKHKKIIEPPGVRDSDEIASRFFRLCGSCDTEKPLTEFSKYDKGYYGRTSWCSSCISASGHKRRVAIRSGKYDKKVTKATLIKLLGLTCPYCNVTMVTKSTTGKKYDPRLATYEHVVPISKGGSHTFDNVVLCCWQCNSRKNAASLREFEDKVRKNVAREK